MLRMSKLGEGTQFTCSVLLHDGTLLLQVTAPDSLLLKRGVYVIYKFTVVIPLHIPQKYFSFFSSSPPAHKAYMEFSFDITAQPTAEVLPTIRHQNTSFLEHSPLRKCHTRTISQINTSNKGHLYQQ